MPPALCPLLTRRLVTGWRPGSGSVASYRSKYAFLHANHVVWLNQITGFGVPHDVVAILTNALDLNAPFASPWRHPARACDRFDHGHATFYAVLIRVGDFAVNIELLRTRHHDFIAAFQRLCRSSCTSIAERF